jgi:hypothetical protein
MAHHRRGRLETDVGRNVPVCRNAFYWQALSLWCLAASLGVLSLLLWPVQGYAGTFELTYGKQFALCRTFWKNLAAFPDLSETTYEWPLDSTITALTKPRWEPVEIRDNMDIVKTLYLWNYDPLNTKSYEAMNRLWEHESHAVLEQMSSGSVRLDRARLDVDANGQVDTVYRYYHRIAQPNSNTIQEYGYWYLYFEDQNSQPAEGLRVHLEPTLTYDSFFFNGRFYLIGWTNHVLVIFEPTTLPPLTQVALTSVCRFKYKQ